jgi:hypothetical protein
MSKWISLINEETYITAKILALTDPLLAHSTRKPGADPVKARLPLGKQSTANG